MTLMLPSGESVLDGLAMSSGANHGLEGSAPCMWTGAGPGEGHEKLVGGLERGNPVMIWTNPRGCKQLRFMEEGNGHATSVPRFSG